MELIHERDPAHHEHLTDTAAVEGSDIQSYEKISALLHDMILHHTRHADELTELMESLPAIAQEKLQSAIGIFDTAIVELKEVSQLLYCGSFPTHTNEMKPVETPGHAHSHVHDPKEKRRQISRLSRVIGHLKYVKKMLEADEDCAAILMQISASKSALNGLGKEIISEHISHCITNAVKEGDTGAVQEFQLAIKRFL